MSVGPVLPRRAALALGAAGLALVAGCDDDDTPTPQATPTPEPDAALVDQVLASLAGAERLAHAAGQPGLARLHAAHIAALGGDPTAPASGHATAATLRTREQRLQRQLVAAATKADSGALARLLASMSAAVSQRLAGSSA